MTTEIIDLIVRQWLDIRWIHCAGERTFSARSG